MSRSILAVTFALGCRTYKAPSAQDTGPLSTLCGAGTQPGSDVRLLRWPYLQNVTSTSAVIAFGARSGMDSGFVSVGRDGTYDLANQATLSEDVAYGNDGGKDLTLRLHHAEITGLQPSTEYCYRVESSGVELASALTFTTAPADADATVRFLAIGDFGAGTLAEWAVKDALTPYIEDTDFMITMGDNAYSYGDWDEWQENVFEVYHDLLMKVPLFAVPGNHDYYTEDAEPYLTNLFLPENATNKGDIERYYSMDWGPLHFDGLDSELPLKQITEDVEGDDERDWLEQDLAKADRPWTVAAYHKPGRDNQVGRTPDPYVQEYLIPTLEAYEVPLVLQGHDHQYERFVPMQNSEALDSNLGGTTYVISGGGGQALYDLTVGEDELQAVGAKTYNFLYGVADACTITISAIDEKGFVFDMFTLDHC